MPVQQDFLIDTAAKDKT